jgi:alpha-galactosidase
MKRRSFLASSVFAGSGVLMSSCTTSLKADESNVNANNSVKNLAPKPPLGWNSFDSYGVYLHHEAAMENLKAMSKLLQPHGYEYFVIDGGWYGEFKLAEGTLYPLEKHAETVNMNEFAIYQPSKVYFGQGFKPIVDLGHELGLKMGLHLMRGISRKAVEQNLPIKNSKYRAADIANKNSTCAWNQHNYGVDMSKPGAQDFYDSVYAQVAEWGFDFVKVDDLNAYPEEIIAIADAIEKSGRPMVFSLSPGGPVYMPDLPYYKRAHMLRNSVDIWDRKADIDKGFFSWKRFQGIGHAGFWPDLDMIPFGKLQLMSPAKYSDGEKDVALAGLGNTRQSNFTPAQMRTFITMRALAASPLFMGGDLLTLDEYSLKLITDPDMLACNQNGEVGFNVYEKDGIEVWLTHEKDKPGSGWLGIFNRNDNAKSVKLSREDLGLKKYIVGYKLIANELPFKMKDVWKAKTFEFTEPVFAENLEADEVVFLRFEGRLGN